MKFKVSAVLDIELEAYLQAKDTEPFLEIMRRHLALAEYTIIKDPFTPDKNTQPIEQTLIPQGGRAFATAPPRATGRRRNKQRRGYATAPAPGQAKGIEADY